MQLSGYHLNHVTNTAFQILYNSLFDEHSTTIAMSLRYCQQYIHITNYMWHFKFHNTVHTEYKFIKYKTSLI